MLKNSKVVSFVTLKIWSGRKLLDPTTYVVFGVGGSLKSDWPFQFLCVPGGFSLKSRR